MPSHSAVPAHQFDDLDQQHESASLGMWIFLATEIMFFGGLFLAYSIYRAWYPGGFAEASRHLDVVLGVINTAVLLCSSLTMALAVHAAQLDSRKTAALMLAVTAVLGAVFLGIKFVEYHHKYEEALVPSASFQWSGTTGPGPRVFFSLYYAMTGLHALHMIIGIALMAVMIWRTSAGRFSHGYYWPVEMMGLYWHFVDIVWVFLFPLLYLVDRT